MKAAPDPREITILLRAIGAGDREAWSKLVPLVYEELRRIARHRLARAQAGKTLQITDLVHEAFLHLVTAANPSWQNRRHFFGAVAVSIRDILASEARKKGRLKRGGGWQQVTLDNQSLGVTALPVDILALEEALEELKCLDSLQHEIVMLRYFAGLPIDDVARALEISPSTVDRHWNFARAWLRRRLAES
ncbi:MAG: ECF-type sigma factor [Planctomycetota bacterium]